MPVSFDFRRANSRRSASSAGTSLLSNSLNPTARFFELSRSYLTLIDRPLR